MERQTRPADEAEGETDAGLLERSRSGSGAAFEALFRRHKDETFGFLIGILRDRALAEDVLQETFFRVHQNLERIDPTRPLRPWLLQVARNAAFDALRVRRKDERLEDATARTRPEASGDGVGGEAERSEARGRARVALAALPDEPRALLLQRHGLGMTLPDLARSFAVSERTIKNRLRDAAELLARALSRRLP